MTKPLFEQTDSWTFPLLNEIDQACAEIAHDELKLETYPNQIEVITHEQMLDIYAGGLPVGYKHWSFGKSFLQEENQYRRGGGLAYEVVFNSNPCIAYLMESNSPTMQALVIAHASYGHNAYFRGNYLFREWTDASSIIDYLVYARNYINDCEVRYGMDAVESILDAAHALKYYGVDRYKRPPKPTKTEVKERKKQDEEEKQRQVNPLWDNLIPHTTYSYEDEQPMEPEENILYFIEKNAPDLEVWEREIIRIVRKIATYYYPNYQTQVGNEGWASTVHYFIMTRLLEKGLITDGSYLEFLHSHTSVVHQYPMTMRFNPYWLGFNMFAEIKRICQEPTKEDEAWFPDLAGTDWLQAWHHAFKNYRDESFISQYLSPALIRKERMFMLDDDAAYPKEYGVDRIHDDRGFRQIREALSDSKRIGTIFPDIQVTDVDWKGQRTLKLRHTAYNNIALQPNKKERTIAQFERLWGYPVVIESIGLQELVK